MEKKKYTLDRIENGNYVFVDYPAEEKSQLIKVAEVNAELKVGDIVTIEGIEGCYLIEVLKTETKDMEDDVRSLLDKLKNKK